MGHLPNCFTCATILCHIFSLIAHVSCTCEHQLYHTLNHFVLDVPADDIAVSSVSECAGRCSAAGSDDLFMYDSGSGTCQCYTMPVAVTNEDPGVPLYISDAYFSDVCDVSIVNGAGYVLASSDITASTHYNEAACRPHMARHLNGGSRDAWCGGTVDAHPWLQYDFRELRRVTGVRTQARTANGQRILSYQLQSWDTGGWSTVSDADGNHIMFVGNVDSTSVVYQELPVRVVASKIKMIPIEYEGHYSTRMDIFGC